jgi:hypothetical protein
LPLPAAAAANITRFGRIPYQRLPNCHALILLGLLFPTSRTGMYCGCGCCRFRSSRPLSACGARDETVVCWHNGIGVCVVCSTALVVCVENGYDSCSCAARSLAGLKNDCRILRKKESCYSSIKY